MGASNETTFPKLEKVLTPKVGYREAASIYLDRGFKPIPTKGKVVQPKNATGRNGEVTSQLVQGWRFQYPKSNTAIRADGWISIDVDHYGTKTGAHQLMQLVERFGPLPKTWSSTSRGAESKSRQYFFKVDENYPLNSKPSPDIEVITYQHRYSVVAPSVHPDTGGEYLWYLPDGTECSTAPNIEDFAPLPDAWVSGLIKVSDYVDSKTPYSGDSSSWLDWLGLEAPTYFATQAIEKINVMKHVGHQDLLLLLPEIHQLRLGLWERGVGHVLNTLKTKYFATTNESNPQTEWLNAVMWAIGSDWTPVAIGQQSAREIALNLLAGRELSEYETFWSKTPTLAAIYKRARQTVVSPWSLFGTVLLRTMHCVPYDVYYETVKGTVPLNMVVGLIGTTGQGKSQSVNIGLDSFIYPDNDPERPFQKSWTMVIEPGSGESMPDYYMKYVKNPDDPKGPKLRVFRHENHAILWGFDEVGMAESRSQRQGSTIIDFIKQGWSGSSFGRVLAKGEGTILAPKTYRFGMYINMQPKRADMFFTDSEVAGGLPGRILFFDAQDSNAKSEFDASKWTPYLMPKPNWQGVKSITALPVMQEAHLEKDFAGMNDGVDPMDSHLLLNRAKTAVALMAMDGRTKLTDLDWDLSEIVVQHSKRTREKVLAALNEVRGQKILDQGRSAGIKNSLASETEETRLLKNTARRILELRSKGKLETGSDSVKKNLRFGKQRESYRAALAFLEENPDFK